MQYFKWKLETNILTVKRHSSVWFIGNTPNMCFYSLISLCCWVLILNSIGACKYFLHVLVANQAIQTFPSLVRIWCDPKVESHMFKKDLLKDWGPTHLPYCGWYLDCIYHINIKLECEFREKFNETNLKKATSTIIWTIYNKSIIN